MTRLLPQSPPRQRLPKNVGFTKAELKRYLDYIGALGGPQGFGCVFCRQEAEVCHVKYGEPCTSPGCCQGEVWVYPGKCAFCHSCDGSGWRYAKLPDLRQHLWTLPLCPVHHRLGNEAQHRHNERAWWTEQGIDPLSLCVALQDAYNTALSRSDAIEGGMIVIEKFRRAA